DFYDVFELDDGRWVALVGDVCGKGLEAAALTGLARHTLRAVANVERPSDALAHLNRALLRERIDGRFCTVAIAVFDPPEEDGAPSSAAELRDRIERYVRDEIGGDQMDDVALLVLMAR